MNPIQVEYEHALNPSIVVRQAPDKLKIAEKIAEYKKNFYYLGERIQEWRDFSRKILIKRELYKDSESTLSFC